MSSSNFSLSLVDRLVNTAKLPVRIIRHGGKAIGQTSAGIVGTALSILTAGQSTRINRLADDTKRSHHIIDLGIYRPIMGVINPNFLPKDIKEVGNDGVVTYFTARILFNAAEKFAKNDTFVKRHLFSRGAYLAGALASTVTRTVDLALGVIAAAASIVTFGAIPAVNKIAIAHLRSTGVIDDISRGLRGFVNPQQFNFMPSHLELKSL